MDSALLEDLQASLKTAGPAAAIDRLCQSLRDKKDYAALFYALLMKKRLELGVSPIATGTNQDLPAAAHAGFEEGIRHAARTVGKLYLEEDNIPAAWAYFRMLGEPEPIAQALEKRQPQPDEDFQPLIDIAFHQGVAPKRGFDWVLDRYGTCSAITSLGGGEVPFGPEVKDYCIRRLIQTLHKELTERLAHEIKGQQGFEPSGKTIKEMIEGRDWLFADDCYHIDLSHLSSVVQMSMQIEPCPEHKLARDLCAYGMKLSPRFAFPSDPPFEGQYRDFDMYLAALTGEDVAGSIAHFEGKLAQAKEEGTTFPAEVLVSLLLRLDRQKQAVQVAKEHLRHVAEARLSCPNLIELCQKTGDYQTLAEVAREQGHAVNFLAGLIGAAGK
ncbi:MAG: hypothetical protein U0793_20505 [Gemmataceae bacterium]